METKPVVCWREWGEDKQGSLQGPEQGCGVGAYIYTVTLGGHAQSKAQR